MNLVLDTIKSRRSNRAFKKEVQVSNEELEKVLEAGIWAPSGHNYQPCFFTVIQNKELISELNYLSKESGKAFDDEMIRKMCESETFNLFYGAPTIIIVSHEKNAFTPSEDLSAAVQNILLAGESLGISSCWIGIPRKYFSTITDNEKEKFGIPKEFTPFHVVALGYAKAEVLNAPKRNKECIKFMK